MIKPSAYKKLGVAFLATLNLLCLSACSETPQQTTDRKDKRPVRIVSLDFCADQYVLKFVEKERILAISPDAVKRFSYMRDSAVGMPTVRPLAEDVLILQPDLVVRSYGGGPGATQFFERAGVPVLNIGWAADIDSETLSSITGVVEQVAAGLGSADKGAQVISDFRTRLAALGENSQGKSVLYMTPAGFTTGPGSLVHEMITRAGLENFQEHPGWRSLPLERLAYERPDSIAAAFFESLTNHPDGWAASRHPVARRQMVDRPVIDIEGAWTSCGAWFAIEAIEALAAGGQTGP